MKYFIVQYDHRYGTDCYLVRSKKMPTQAKVIKALELDFEEDKDETIVITLVDEITEIK